MKTFLTQKGPTLDFFQGYQIDILCPFFETKGPNRAIECFLCFWPCVRRQAASWPRCFSATFSNGVDGLFAASPGDVGGVKVCRRTCQQKRAAHHKRSFHTSPEYTVTRMDPLPLPARCCCCCLDVQTKSHIEASRASSTLRCLTLLVHYTALQNGSFLSSRDVPCHTVNFLGIF